MSPRVSSTRRVEDDSLAVLDSFLAVLRSSSPITLPDTALYGGITHFISVLPYSHLPNFISTLISSPSLWDPKTSRNISDIRQAVRLGVVTKTSSILLDFEGSYLAEWRVGRTGRNWLENVINGLDQSSTEYAIGRSQIISGLLEGLHEGKNIEWGDGRVKLEEEVILGIAQLADEGQAGKPSLDHVDILCSAMIYVDGRRLRALPLQDLAIALNRKLIHALTLTASNSIAFSTTTDSTSSKPPGISTMSRALARSIEVLDHGGPSSRLSSWRLISEHLDDMTILSENLRERWTKSKKSDADSDDHKTALFSLLTISSTTLDILLVDNFPSPLLYQFEVHPSADIAARILQTLSTFSYLTDTAKGGMEGYDRILFGCLDVLAARGGASGVKALFKRLSRDRPSEAENAFMLVIGEQLLSHMDGKDVGALVRICELHITHPSHRGSFEAAHAFVLALIERSSTLRSSESDQSELLVELLNYYPSILLEQAKAGSISADQLRAAYPLVVKAASSHSPEFPTDLIDRLDTYSDLGKAPPTTLPLIRLSVIPYVPLPQLQSYLERMATNITSFPEGSEARLALSAEAFKTVIEGLGDEGKLIGIEWWLEWRNVFEGKVTLDPDARAKL